MGLFSLLFRYRDKKSPDKLGLYPEKFHILAFPERRYLWTSRILVIFAVLSFCLTIILTMTIYLLLPLQIAKPAFYTINQRLYHMEQVQPDRVNTGFRDMLSEKYITEYIKMRHAIPTSTADLFYRWDEQSLFYWYSGLRNYYSFIDTVDNDQIKSFIRQKMRRKVEIEHIEKLSRDLYFVQFRTETTTKYITEPDIIIWRVYLRIMYMEFDKYGDTETTEEEKLNYTSNPFGFKVMQYSLGYAGKPQKADSAIEVAKKVFENMEDVVK